MSLLTEIGKGLAGQWAQRALASAFGDLLRSAFDVHRFTLYDTLRLPRPKDPAGEPASGKILTEYLFRGTTGAMLRFTAGGKADDSRG